VPVLGGVRVSASEGVVRLSAFDYEKQHTAAIEATIGDEGECVVPGTLPARRHHW
jgi:DNA polymerase III sliding clamp (beta) subunit (PCNA family)